MIGFSDNNPHEKLNSAYDSYNDTLSVSTWNIQSYQVISSRYNRNITSPERFFDLSEFITQTASQIVCMQEAYDGPSAHMSNLAVEPYVDESFGYGSVNTDTINLMVGYRAGNSTLSAYPLSENKVIRVTDEGTYIRLASRDTLNHPIIGKIAIYNVHGSWFEAAAMQLYSDIISDYKTLGVTKVIVIGDFNHDTTGPWFSAFTDDGFTIVNNMNYDTRNDGSGSWYIDNIIIKGFTVQDVFVTSPEQSLSDHKMLTAIIKAE
ncbi:endonuclease/exonuclease/phosphatase family protein [Escherichia coli]|nr:endonuclease/exonuclease/phosphatase family protein [Escherichia coli]MCS1244878.1 endonuclease/exonuclease/phosphatase family protein [Escherichia coli]